MRSKRDGTIRIQLHSEQPQTPLNMEKTLHRRLKQSISPIAKSQRRPVGMKKELVIYIHYFIPMFVRARLRLRLHPYASEGGLWLDS